MNNSSSKENDAPITVFIVDDHLLFREGLKALFTKWPSIKLIGATSDAHAAHDIINRLCPTVAILDIMMPGEINGLSLALKISKETPNTKLMILTMHNNQEFVFRALKVGCMGYVLKSDSPDILYEAITSVAKGNKYLSASIINDFVDYIVNNASSFKNDPTLLTPREHEVSNLLTHGRSTEEMSAALSISSKTVRVHVGNLMKKFSCSSRAELTVKLLEMQQLHTPLP